MGLVKRVMVFAMFSLVDPSMTVFNSSQFTQTAPPSMIESEALQWPAQKSGLRRGGFESPTQGFLPTITALRSTN
uniref:Secreted protein n=1 Tax=Mesocestoides corti TaxID=53468 RepID=A0A5K3ENV1_MESCO